MRAIFLCLSAAGMACSGAEPTGPADPSAVASVTIRPPVTSLLLGSTLSLQVIVRNASGDELTNRPIVFTSSDDRVLTVDGTGLVQALITGTVTVTATTGGRSGQAIIMVTCSVEDCLGPWDYSPAR
jgi:uncharacterized protein YjdB